MTDSRNAKREEAVAEAEPADWLPGMNEREKREEEELREEREFATHMAATSAESYARFNLPPLTPEEEAELEAAVRRRRDDDVSVLRPEDDEEIKRRIGNDSILCHFD
uniref:Uncharacterized protein n=1 Tax=Oryza nivara TaxID=4536 RepID=A0A0E0GPR2_ORYNI